MTIESKVKRGSLVFTSPKSFPPNYCRAAHALDSAFRTVGDGSGSLAGKVSWEGCTPLI